MNFIVKFASFFYAVLTSIIIGSCFSPQRPENVTSYKKEDTNFIFKEKKQYFIHLKEGDTLKTCFEYCNYTEKMQCIDTIKTTCGCTSVTYSHEAIEIRECGEVKVSLILSKSGFFTKSIVVYFHRQKPIVLTIAGIVD